MFFIAHRFKGFEHIYTQNMGYELKYALYEIISGSNSQV